MVFCKVCCKTHGAAFGEIPCAPGAWIEDVDPVHVDAAGRYQECPKIRPDVGAISRGAEALRAKHGADTVIVIVAHGAGRLLGFSTVADEERGREIVASLLAGAAASVPTNLTDAADQTRS